MKKLYFLVFSLLLSVAAWAQCGTCTPNQSLPFPPSAFTDGGYLPAALPTITQGVAYDTVITFVFPASYNVPPIGNIDVDSVRIDNIANLPAGFSWSTPSPTNTFYPQQSAYGCIRICGTTNDFPQIDSAAVTIRGYALGQSQAQNTFVTYQVVSGVTSGGSYIASNLIGCDSVTSSFEATLDFSPLPTKYFWDFDNGSTSALKVPTDVTYNTPGTYEVKVNTIYGFYQVQSITLGGISDDWEDPLIECATLVPPFNTPLCPLNQAPDLFLRITDDAGNSFETSRSANVDQLPPVTIPVNLNINNGPFLIEIFDDDLIGEDKLGQFFINNTVIAGIGSFSQGDNFGSYVVGTVYTDTIRDTVNVVVYETPAMPVVENLSTTDSICTGDSVILHTTSSGSIGYTWYVDGNEVPGAVDSFLVVTQGGEYSVKITDTTSLCNNTSAGYVVVVSPSPPIPAIAYYAADERLGSPNGANYTRQWYFNGVPIPGANDIFYNTPQNGTYNIEFTSAAGCKRYSGEFEMTDTLRVDTTTGIGSLAAEALYINLYPNPSTGMFNVQLNAAAGSHYNMSVFTVVGKQVFTQRGVAASGTVEEVVNLSEFTDGIYLFVFESEGVKEVKKIVLKR